jgi:FkbM family methyltransferase
MMRQYLPLVLRMLPWRYRHALVNRLGHGTVAWLAGEGRQMGRFLGAQAELDLTDHIQFWMYVDGVFDEPFLRFFCSLIDAVPASVVLDIGANVGNHAISMACHAGQVHAFEPNDTARACMVRLASAHEPMNLQIHDAALGNATEQRDFFENASGNLGASTFDESQADRFGRVNRKRLQIVRGDEYLARAGISRVDFVKIDVEGFESEVLQGLQVVLVAARPVVVMEYRGVTLHKLRAGPGLDELLPRYRKWGLRLGPQGWRKYFSQPKIELVDFDATLEYEHVLLMPEEAVSRFGQRLCDEGRRAAIAGRWR